MESRRAPTYERQLKRVGDEGRFLKQTLGAIDKLAPDIDAVYVMSQLDLFIEERQLSNTLEQAMDLLAQGQIAEAKAAIHTHPLTGSHISPGIWLHKPEESLSFLNAREDTEFFSTGIKVLDEGGVRPERKRAMMLIAPSNFGKSWFLINCGKQGILHGKKTLHISGEMAAEDIAQRYIQALYSMTANDVSNVRIPTFKRDEHGMFTDIDFDVLEPKQLNSSSRAAVAKKLRGLAARAHLKIIDFPTGELTLAQLDQRLDYLAKVEGFIPDQVLLDSPDNMALDSKNFRIDMGQNTTRLRGMCVRRNFALVTVSQGNRDSSSAKLVRGKHIAEDWSKVGTNDYILTGNQTEAEEKINLARIWVEKSRFTKKHYTALISQAYEVGQFCLDSIYMNVGASNEVKKLTGEE
jgi:hypothetical protein